MLHFFDHVGTPYGYVLDCLGALNARLCRQLLALFNSPGAPQLPVPLRLALQDPNRLEAWLRAKAGRGFDVAECVEFTVVLASVWPQLLLFERAMEGEALKTVETMGPARPIGGLRLLEGWEREGEFEIPGTLEELLEIDLGSSEWEAPARAVPSITARAHQHPLGAICILEGRALFQERGLAYGPDPLLSAMADGKGQYFLAAFAVAAKLQERGFTREELLDTFLAVADLALYTPIGSAYKQLRTENTWSEVQPGYRLMRLIDAVGRVGPFDRRRRMGVFEYQATLADALGWPPPLEFLSRGSTLSGSDYRARRHRQACQMKRDQPRMFVNAALEYLDLNDVDVLHALMRPILPLYFDPSDVQRVLPGSGEEGALMERLASAYLQSLSWSLFVTGDPSREHLDPDFPFDKVIRWEHAGSLSQFFDSRCRPHVRTTVVSWTA